MTLIERLLAFWAGRREAIAEPLAPPSTQTAGAVPVHAIGDKGWGEIPSLPTKETTMKLPFSGAARPMSSLDITRAALKIGCEEAAIHAVISTESGGDGFLADGSGRSPILYEAHRMSKETGGRFDKSHPTLSTPVWDRSLYKGGAREYDRLAEAIKLDREAALKATSWGMFQILGSNHKAAGYPDVESFVAAMADSEGAQLDAFVSFVQSKNLGRYLIAKDWASFARGYNGTGYALNKYDVKLATAYKLASGQGALTPGTLRIGASGSAVSMLQTKLVKAGYTLTIDGSFGRATQIALERFQIGAKLVPDGIAGPATWRALG